MGTEQCCGYGEAKQTNAVQHHSGNSVAAGVVDALNFNIGHIPPGLFQPVEEKQAQGCLNGDMGQTACRIIDADEGLSENCQSSA